MGIIKDPRYSASKRKANLIKLATYLESLPEDYGHFNMGTFLDEGDNFDAIVAYALNNGGVHQCGTAACAVGHGPAAGVLFDKNEIAEEWRWSKAANENIRVDVPNWLLYTKRFVDVNSDQFDFLFGGSWVTYDDTPHGAAKRIRYFLANGVPEEFSEEFDFIGTREMVYAFAEESK